MSKRVYSIPIFIALYYLSHFVFELGGPSLTSPQLNTKADLWEEFADTLPPDFYRAFGTAVEWQKNGDSKRARNLYHRIMSKVHKNAPELEEHVRLYIDHNIRLMS